LKLYGLLLGTLAVYRITHLLSAEDGPWDLSARLRAVAGHGFFGRLLDCAFCLSLWVAAPFAVAIGEGARERALLWLAFSAGVVVIEKLTSRPPVTPAACWEGERVDELLRREEGALAK
jgi:Protein of unknown function (DUF1360)